MMGNRFYRDMLPAFMARAGGAEAFEKMGALPATGLWRCDAQLQRHIRLVEQAV
jgi:hypothetical protein